MWTLLENLGANLVKNLQFMSQDIEGLQAELKALREEKRLAISRIEHSMTELGRKHKLLNKLHIAIMGMSQRVEGNAATKRRLNDLLGIVESHKLPPSVSKAEMKELLTELGLLRERLIQETARRIVLTNTFDGLIGPAKINVVVSVEHYAQLKTPNGFPVKIENSNVTVTLPSSKAPFKGLFSNNTMSFDITGAYANDRIHDSLANFPLRSHIYSGNNILFLGIGTVLGSQALFGTIDNAQGSVLDLLLSQIYYRSIDTEDYYLKFISDSQKRSAQLISIEAELRARGMDQASGTTASRLAVKLAAVSFQGNGVIDLLDSANDSVSVVFLQDLESFRLANGSAPVQASSPDPTPIVSEAGIPLLVGATKPILSGDTHARSLISSILADVCLELDTLMLVFEIYSGPTCISTVGLCQTYSSEAVKAYVSPELTDDPLCAAFGETLRSLFGPSSSANLLIYAGVDLENPMNAASAFEPISGIQKPRTVAVRDFM